MQQWRKPDDGRHDLLDSEIFIVPCFEDRIIPKMLSNFQIKPVCFNSVHHSRIA